LQKYFFNGEVRDLVTDGTQVAFLVPTTILADHKAVIKSTKEGNVDI
jgi:transcription-repair coupling factor (superfamily II helicase)